MIRGEALGVADRTLILAVGYQHQYMIGHSLLMNSLFVVLVLLMVRHFTLEGLHCSVDHGGILLDFFLSKLVGEEAGKSKLVFFIGGVVVELGRCWLGDRQKLLRPSPIMEGLVAFISYCRQ